MQELASFPEHVLGRSGRQPWVLPACSPSPARQGAPAPPGYAAREVKVQLLDWAVPAPSFIPVKLLFPFCDAGSKASSPKSYLGSPCCISCS